MNRKPATLVVSYIGHTVCMNALPSLNRHLSLIQLYNPDERDWTKYNFFLFSLN